MLERLRELVFSPTRNLLLGSDENEVHKDLFYVLMALGMLISFIAFFLTGGKSLNSVLFFDRLDYFMDYFNSIYYSMFNPYSGFNVIYPALITGFYFVIGSALKLLGVRFDLGPFELRDSPIGMASYVLVTFVSIALLFYVLHRSKKISQRESLIFFIMIMASYPMIYCIDRGNSMLMAVIFSLLFFIYFRSENKNDKYASYIFLGIAIAIKIYPALFGVIVLREALIDRDLRKLAICAAICAAIFTVPFFFSEGTVFDLIYNAVGYSGSVDAVGHVNIIGLIESAAYFFGIESGAGIRIAGNVIAIALLILVVLIVLVDERAEYWETVSMLICTQILCAGLGTQYLLLYMIIPAWFFVNDAHLASRKSTIISLLLVASLIIVPGLFGIKAGYISVLKGVSVLLLLIILICGSLRKRLRSEDGQFSENSTAD